MSSRSGSARPRQPSEWVGGVFEMPGAVSDGGRRYRPRMAVWYELPDAVIVKNTVVEPEQETQALVDALEQALAHPEIGPPRLPARLRVADPTTAERLRAEFGLPVKVGPVPEVDRLRESFAAYMETHSAELAEEDGAPTTYLPPGVSPDLVRRLFEKARRVFAAQPWTITDDSDVLQVDVPDLGVRGGAISLIGSLQESIGLVLFESFDAFNAFLDASEHARERSTPADLGGQLLSITFEAAAELPPALRREVAEHGWPVASPRAHPVVVRVDRRGAPLPLSASDVRLAEALCGALDAFLSAHPRELGNPSRIISEAIRLVGSPAVVLTYPHPEAVELDDPPPAPAAPKAGRNHPCPCGSGQKYRRCCLARDEAAESTRASAPRTGDMDADLVLDMQRFAAKRFPEECARAAEVFALEAEDRMQLQLFVPWSVYEYAIAGAPVVDHFLRERGHALAEPERAWLGQQKLGWLGVWDVEEVRPGEGLTAVDRLTGVRRVIAEKLGSRDLRVRLSLLGRVVEQSGVFRFFGMHPAPLPPREAAAVVDAIARRLDVEPPRASQAQLRAGAYQSLLPREWRAAVDALASRPPPELRNTDGDPLLLIEDAYAFEPEQREKLLACLEQSRLQRDPDAGPEACFSWLKRKRGERQPILAGAVKVERDELVASTNSRKRATALRKLLKEAAPGLLTELRRSETNPAAAAGRGSGRPGEGAPLELPREAQEALRAFKDAHWRDWIDQPVPALDGQTPRAAAATPEGKRRLALLLEEAEYHEAGSAPAERYDFRQLRETLGV